MSGVSRLKSARKGGGSLSIQHTPPRSGTGSSKDVSDKSFGAPTKKGAWEVFPKTGVPEGNESPHRGESANQGNRDKSIK